MMKKLFHISGTCLPGGGPEHIYQLLKRLDRKEWQLFLCTSKDGPYWEKFDLICTKTYDLALRKLSLKKFLKLWVILLKEKPDLIHTHGKGPGFYGRIIGKLLNIPVIHTFHGFHYTDLPFLTKRLHLILEFFLALITEHHIFVGAGEKEHASVIKFISEKNSSIINNGVDCKYIRGISIDRKKFLNSIGCNNWENNEILGTVSRISPEKGILNLLSGFAIALKKISTLRLLIVGGQQGEHRSYYLEVKDFIEKENLTEQVRILGYRNDVIEILKSMDFYISPSLTEGLPISILEALASKIPTIATEIAGNKDIIRNSVFGILVPTNSSTAIAQGIFKMHKLTQRERDTISLNAYNRVSLNFSIERMVDKTKVLYNQTLKKKIYK